MTTLHESTFEYLKPTEKQLETMNIVRGINKDYANKLEVFLPNGPDKTYILRKVREIAMWTNVAITREADGTPRQDQPKEGDVTFIPYSFGKTA